MGQGLRNHYFILAFKVEEVSLWGEQPVSCPKSVVRLLEEGSYLHSHHGLIAAAWREGISSWGGLQGSAFPVIRDVIEELEPCECLSNGAGRSNQESLPVCYFVATFTLALLSLK